MHSTRKQETGNETHHSTYTQGHGVATQQPSNPEILPVSAKISYRATADKHYKCYQAVFSTKLHKSFVVGDYVRIKS